MLDNKSVLQFKIIKSHKFSKFDPKYIMTNRKRDTVYVCGVAIMCTVLDLVNNGYYVVVLKDLCLYSTNREQKMALSVMESYSPMVSLI